MVKNIGEQFLDLRMEKLNGMDLLRRVEVCAVYAVLGISAVLEELGSNLSEAGVGQHILFLFEIFGHLVAQGVKLRLDEIGGTAINGVEIADDSLAEFGVNGHRRSAVGSLNKTLEFLGGHLVAFACNDIQHCLCTYNL